MPWLENSTFIFDLSEYIPGYNGRQAEGLKVSEASWQNLMTWEKGTRINVFGQNNFVRELAQPNAYILAGLITLSTDNLPKFGTYLEMIDECGIALPYKWVELVTTLHSNLIDRGKNLEPLFGVQRMVSIFEIIKGIKSKKERLIAQEDEMEELIKLGVDLEHNAEGLTRIVFPYNAIGTTVNHTKFVSSITVENLEKILLAYLTAMSEGRKKDTDPLSGFSVPDVINALTDAHIFALFILGSPLKDFDTRHGSLIYELATKRYTTQVTALIEHILELDDLLLGLKERGEEGTEQEEAIEIVSFKQKAISRYETFLERKNNELVQ